MSHVVVFNASAKSVRIPTTPTKYLTDVLDEACQKLKVNRAHFTLKYNNRPITLSQQIRFANLAQGARLELVQASRSPTVISVALQLPHSEKSVRLTQKFASTTSLWELLRQFESAPGSSYNFTQRGVPEMNTGGTTGAGRLNYEMPVITVMPGHKEYATFVELQKTLNQLGFDGGSALLRLSYKNSGTPLEESMTQISQYFRQDDATTKPGAHVTSSVLQSPTPDVDSAAPAAASTVAGGIIRPEEGDPEPMDVDASTNAEKASAPANASPIPDTADPPQSTPDSTSSTPDPPSQQPHTFPTSPSDIMETDEAPSSSGPRRVRILSPSTASTPSAALTPFRESDYVPTIEHAKSHQASLSTRTRNSRLPSDKELADQASAKEQRLEQAASRGGKVRVRLPDGAHIEAEVGREDTADDVYAIVRCCLAFPDEPFALQYRGDKGRIVRLPLSSSSKSPSTAADPSAANPAVTPTNSPLIFRDLRFAPSELLTLAWDPSASAQARIERNVLSETWRARSVPLKVEDPSTMSSTATAVQGSPGGDAAGSGTGQPGKKKSEMSAEEKENKMRKFLKGGLFGKK